MGHPDHHLVDAIGAGIFDHRLQRGDHRLAAVEAEPLGADERHASAAVVARRVLRP